LIIILTDDYRLKSTRSQFVLEKFKHTTKFPDGKWSRVGYYPGLRSALHALPDHVAMTEELDDLRALFDRLESIINQIAR
jgi:hypothetical protein